MILAALLAAALGQLPEARGAGLRDGPVVLAVEKVSPAVVNIASADLSTRQEDPRSPSDPFREEFFRDFAESEPGGDSELVSLGSGILFDATGLVLTNEHVVRRAARIRVLLSDRRAFDATLVGADADSDLAVLRLRAAEGLPSVPLGTSADLRVGETLIAIGNPFGLSHSVSTGVLSARSRFVRVGERRFGDFLQTDAAINPGNSGGPLLNLEGGVVGVATAVHAGGSGIGFAIPIDRARRVIARLLRSGTATPAWIGAGLKPAASGLASSLQLAPGQGLVVTHLTPGGPAAASGLERGDVLVEAGGKALTAAADLDATMDGGGGERDIAVTLLRDGRRLQVGIRPLGPRSPRLLVVAEAVLGARVTRREEAGGGVVLRALREGGLAAARGIREGDVLLELDGRQIEGLESFQAAFHGALSNGSALFLVQHGGSLRYVPLSLD